MALFDVDNFKEINDAYGHLLGDQVLIGISKLVLANIRETDIFSRWGGDEFFLILPGVDVNNAKTSVDKIRKLVSESTFVSSLKATCSFGVAQYIEGDSLESLYKRADLGLYRAKQSGRNTVMDY